MRAVNCQLYRRAASEIEKCFVEARTRTSRAPSSDGGNIEFRWRASIS
jgi:hypothetical protein